MMAVAIEEQLQIERLIARYNFAIDSANGGDFAACFADEGVFRVGEEVRGKGRQALAAFASALGSQMPLRHVVTSIVVDVQGATATSRAYCQVFTTTREKGHHVLAQGIYVDQLAKRDGSWLFTERCFNQDPLPK